MCYRNRLTTKTDYGTCLQSYKFTKIFGIKYILLRVSRNLLDNNVTTVY